jgi:hypothetical protein
LDTDKKFKALYARLDEMNATQKKEDAKDNFLDDLDSGDMGSGNGQDSDQNDFLQ